MPDPSTFELELASGRSGFRLDRVELFNWGTFGGRKVWSFPFGCGNSLVTGDIGSGKSTWVDAVATLLVPPQRITYNKAAGAERRERTEKGYLLGEYMSSREENSSYAKPVRLRDEECYSVLVAVFREEEASRLVSLAQLRWLKGGELQKIYLVSGQELTVLDHFSDFVGDVAAFKRKLRSRGGIEVFDSFSDYSSAFRSAMGITEKAIDLFNQTISMKTIGDLDDFIRNHMLERSASRDRVTELLRNYDNLRSAHDAVARARLQREALLPLRADAASHAELEKSLGEIAVMIDALPYWAITLQLPLLAAEELRLSGALEKLRATLAHAESALDEERENNAKLRSAIDNSESGRRIAELDKELIRLSEERDKRRERGSRYGELAGKLGLDEPLDAAAFTANRSSAEKASAHAEAELERAQDDRVDIEVEKRGLQDRKKELAAEIDSLRKRNTSIPARELDLRAAIAAAIGENDEALPYAGELLRVREADRVWEAATERVLRPFALSLLVSERLYRKVSAYARERDLADRRLVYLRVPEKPLPPERVGERALCRAVEVKADTPFGHWLDAELTRRAPHERCEEMEDFYRVSDAVTREGLIKSGKFRHEKDDRRRVADPRNYVLGWSNAEKIALLERDLSERTVVGAELDRKLAGLEKTIAELTEKRDAARELVSVTDFDEVDWRTPVKRIELLRTEQDELERSSDQLARLRAAHAASTESIRSLEGEIAETHTKIGGLGVELEGVREDAATKRKNLERAPKAELDAAIALLVAFAGDERPDLRALRESWQEGVRQRLSSRRNTLDRKDSDLRTALMRRMVQFLGDFPERKAELTPDLAFLGSFLETLERIERDDLPSYEHRFQALLRENTLQDIALFRNELENDADAIKEAIALINESLEGIEYNRGTYISLAVERREDQDIADFRSDLRACMENALDDELYGEGKFLQVKKILDRFASGENVDRSWTEHVTDVRSWFAFTASERWMEDGTEKEFYSSSSGKSGGQKEKLAYTILASALAYQYGLGRKHRSGGFRLVVIDEAFGRGSEESTRYGLKLFGELDLQLVLVTPLQKIGVIEERVSTIHFIANPEGKASEVRNLSIAEYRRAKETSLAASSPDGVA